MAKVLRLALMLFVVVAFFSSETRAQTTEFVYQGSLKNGGVPANGNFDFEFLLYDALSGGNQMGATLPRNGVAVDTGMFAVKLDFGGQFPGANRFLEIRVRQSGGGAFTPLSPRQMMNSSPYSVQSLNAANAASATTATNALQLGGVAADQYVITTDPRMSNARPPTAGSSSYIQNTTSPQLSNFNVNGTGTASIINAGSQFNLGGSRILSANSGIGNMFVGFGAGASSPTGGANTFFGITAGVANMGGFANTFVGKDAGAANISGEFNSFFGSGAGAHSIGNRNAFFGANAGLNNVEGSANTFVGQLAGVTNTMGGANSFFGYVAGHDNLDGNYNSFVGQEAGYSNIGGLGNAFFGFRAGYANTAGNYNTLIGRSADLGSNNLVNASAFGSQAFVTQANSLVLGSINGVNEATSDTRVGIGTTAPTAKLTVSGSGVFTASSAARFDLFNTVSNTGYSQYVTNAGLWQLATSDGVPRMTGDSTGKFGIGTTTPGASLHITTNGNSVLIGNVGCGFSSTGISFHTALNCLNYSILGDSIGTLFNRPLGGFMDFRESNVTQMSIAPGGIVSILNLGPAGATALCRNASNQIATCSSSARYKSNINPFTSGLSLINRLRPVSFKWRDGGMLDMGLVAEEVAAVEPLLTTTNAKGDIEGVKYDRVGVVLINAVKEQQAQIETQKKEIEDLRSQVAVLKKLVCASQPDAPICKEK